MCVIIRHPGIVTLSSADGLSRSSPLTSPLFIVSREAISRAQHMFPRPISRLVGEHDQQGFGVFPLSFVTGAR